MILTFTVKQAPLGSHQMLGKRFSFDEHGGSFGRSPDNDMVIPDPSRYVSSRHGLVTFEDGVFSVYDQSSNGLFANGSGDSIGTGRAFILQNGTSLKAGDYVFEISIDAVADSRGPAFEANHGYEAGPAPVTHGETPAPSSGQDRERPVLRAVPSSPASVDAAEDGPAAGSDEATEELALQLALRLGLHGMSEEKLRKMPDAVTEVVRSCIAGVMDVLSTRRQVRHQLHVDTTVIQGSHNNALKFSATAEEAIERMFTRAGEAYLPPEEALLEAFQDIADHQVAMMAATMQVYQTLVSRFDPDVLEGKLGGGKPGGGLFAGKQRMWEDYRKLYSEIAQGGYPSLQEDFVKEFSEEYSAQLRKLKQERGNAAP